MLFPYPSTKHFTMTTFALNCIGGGGFSGVPGIILRQKSEQMNIESSNVIGSSSTIRLSKNSPKTAGICSIFSNLQVYKKGSMEIKSSKDIFR